MQASMFYSHPLLTHSTHCTLCCNAGIKYHLFISHIWSSAQDQVLLPCAWSGYCASLVGLAHDAALPTCSQMHVFSFTLAVTWLLAFMDLDLIYDLGALDCIQAAIIKRRLQVMAPNCRVFLDIDDLKDVER